MAKRFFATTLPWDGDRLFWAVYFIRVRSERKIGQYYLGYFSPKFGYDLFFCAAPLESTIILVRVLYSLRSISEIATQHSILFGLVRVTSVLQTPFHNHPLHAFQQEEEHRARALVSDCRREDRVGERRDGLAKAETFDCGGRRPKEQHAYIWYILLLLSYCLAQINVAGS